MPTSKRLKTTMPSIRGYPARSLKGATYAEVVNDNVVAVVAMFVAGRR
jgi:hypothetical protein